MREPSSVSCGYNALSVKRIGVTSSKVISVFMGGLTIKKALFITFHFINRGKKAFDLEHYSSTG